MTDMFDDLSKAYTAGLHDGREEAADEIERLREALRDIACGEGTCGCAISGIKNAGCFHGIARAALGEKK